MEAPTEPQIEQGGPPPLPARRPRWPVALLMLAVAITPIWAGLGWMPLSSRSDGRYAAVSLDMAEQGHWLIPRKYDRPHLTKPPLTYWAEAGSIKLFGANEFAVRFPSALAGSLVIALALLAGAKLYGLCVGMLAAGLLAITPLHLVVSRLTLTDALLNLFWFAALIGGLMTVRQPGRWRWPALMCAGVALGWLTKPLAPWGALGIVGVWMLLAGRWRGLIWPIVAGVVALAPIGIWFYFVWRSAPNIIDIWEQEVAARAAGGGRHGEPFWFFIPVFIVGLFPATAMLEVPGLGRSWRSVWRTLRQGADGAFWALAMVMPVIAFSIPEGKLPTYILPAAPPAAMLTALMLDGWLSGRHDAPPAGYKPPEVRGTMMIVLCVLAIGGVGAGFIWRSGEYWAMGLPGLIMAAAAIYMWRAWPDGPGRRARAMTLVWLSIVLVSAYGLMFAGHLWRPHGGAKLAAAIRNRIDVAEPDVVTFGHRDYAQSFYWGQWVEPIDLPRQMRQLIEARGRRLIVIAAEDRWAQFAEKYADITGRFEVIMDWARWPSDRRFVVLQPRRDSERSEPGR